MAKSKRTGKAHASNYARYKTANTEKTNRLKKLTRTLKEQPNNSQVPLAIKNITHRRKIPVTPLWSHSMVSTAKVVKDFTGKFDKNIFSKDPLIFAAATRTRKESWFNTPSKITMPSGSMFAIKERAVWK